VAAKLQHQQQLVVEPVQAQQAGRKNQDEVTLCGCKTAATAKTGYQAGAGTAGMG